MSSLLSDPGLVLKPDLYWRADRGAAERLTHQVGKVFLKVISASATFFGCTGRGCSRVNSSSPSHRPIVLSCTLTAQRRATSAGRSTQRQRTTLLIAGSGPAITNSRNSAFCARLSRDALPGLLRVFSPSNPAAL